MSFHKYILWPLLVALLLLSSLLPANIKAQENFNILSSRAEANFPDSLTFKLSVSAANPITKIYLRYRLLNDNPIKIFSEVWMSFRPDTFVETSWTWQMKKTGGLPPGTDLSYWWVIYDEKGNKLETPPRTTIYFDTRYNWQWLEKGNILLFWARGDRNFAEQLMFSAEEALQRLEQNASVKLGRRVKIFVYPSSEELRRAILYTTEWTGGIAFTEFGTVVVGISPFELAWGRRALSHELAHLVIRQVSFNFYGDIPTWLNEGLAMWSEGPMRAEMARELERAIELRSFPSLRTLSSPFPSDVSEALLSYAVSQSVVEFLLDRYGGDKMLALLRVFKEGRGYDEAVLNIYGFGMDRLFELWRNAILPPEQMAYFEAILLRV